MDNVARGKRLPVKTMVKIAVSCTGDVNIQNADAGTRLEDTADNPPPKKTKSTQDLESVKSHQNKSVKKI
ncbi:OLC1v1035055C1 [Oldenlandia corymbosa var. corymbosa]|uniref:OLC1v1035055C1 n=1 Tax=Oldenlandia corymbosa var. corymbosa TaxID=529605 RepID=A0AAV1CS62_OLDCO|nr:OLC1v1035055C1 [Oldenlandia corymbosa var. corymbosa]